MHPRRRGPGYVRAPAGWAWHSGSLKASFQDPRRNPRGSTGSRGKKREFLSRNHSRGFSAIPPNPRSAPPSAPGLDIDGLYRISGNLATIQKLRYKVDHGEARPLSLPQARGRKGMLTSSSSPPPFPQMNVWTWTTDAGRTST